MKRRKEGRRGGKERRKINEEKINEEKINDKLTFPPNRSVAAFR